MDPISATGSGASAQGPEAAETAEDMASLKASQDFAKQHAAQLLAALPPPPRAPSPPGVGGTIDLTA